MLGFLLTPAAAFITYVYCPWQSFKAVESAESADDTAWLTFWIVKAFMSLAENFSDTIVFWVPFYDELKFAILIWLVFAKGSATLYSTVVRPFLVEHEANIDQMWEGLDRHAKAARFTLGDEAFLQSALEDAAAFVEQYGKPAYDTAMKIATEHAVASATGTAGAHQRYQ